MSCRAMSSAGSKGTWQERMFMLSLLCSSIGYLDSSFVFFVCPRVPNLVIHYYVTLL